MHCLCLLAVFAYEEINSGTVNKCVLACPKCKDAGCFQVQPCTMGNVRFVSSFCTVACALKIIVSHGSPGNELASFFITSCTQLNVNGGIAVHSLIQVHSCLRVCLTCSENVNVCEGDATGAPQVSL